MTEHRRISVFRREFTQDDFKEGTLPEFLAAIDDLVKDVSPDMRRDVLVTWDTDYDDRPCGFEFSLYRAETDIEVAKRIQAADAATAARMKRDQDRERATAARMKRDQDRERALYETLKRKFAP